MVVKPQLPQAPRKELITALIAAYENCHIGKWLNRRSKCIYIICMITWDEPKRKLNLRKHGIDLAEVESAFDSPMVTVEDVRDNYGELRL